MVGWREGSSPSRSRQTGREPLDSSGFSLAAALCWLIPIAGLASPYQPVRLGPLLDSHYKSAIANTPQWAPVRSIRYSRLRLSGLGVLPFPGLPGTTTRLGS